MVMEVISWVMVGITAGSLARVAMPGPAAGGMRVAMLIGLLGAMTGGFLGTYFLVRTSAPIDIMSLMMALNGAIYPLFLYRCFAMRMHESARIPTGKDQSFREVANQRPAFSPIEPTHTETSDVPTELGAA
jgi:uncharacterized membrane protein YeaQ/YmgE (transglycosylase-associated protein family)